MGSEAACSIKKNWLYYQEHLPLTTTYTPPTSPPLPPPPPDYRAIHTVMPLIVTTCFKQSYHWIFSDMNLPAYLCFFTTINMTNLQKEKSNYYLHPTKNHTPQQKRATCFAHCCKTSWITRFTTHENKPVLHQIRSLKAAKWFSRKQREVLLFPTKSVHVARFTVYGLDGINLPRLPLTASLWIRCNISSMRRSVSSPDETPRRELKIRRVAEYFWWVFLMQNWAVFHLISKCTH